MRLTLKQRSFAAAYAGPARRSAELAATMTGAPIATIDNPAVQEYIEQLSFKPTVVAGEILDVEAVEFDAPSELEPGDHRRIDSQRRIAHDAAVRAGIAPQALRGSAPGPDEVANPNGPTVVNQYGETVGTAEELVARRTRAARRAGDPTSIVKHGSVESAAAGLADRLARDSDIVPAVEHADGTVTVFVSEVATPFEVKKFLTDTMRGKLTIDFDRRLQAAALLAKAHGLLSERLIAEDRRGADLVEQGDEALRERLLEVRRQLAEFATAPALPSPSYSALEHNETTSQTVESIDINGSIDMKRSVI